MTTFYGILIPFLGTTLGAACVFFLRRALGDRLQRALTGFAAGVMVAASVWSLLISAIEQSAALGRLSFLPAAVGFWIGVAFLLLLDRVIPHLHRNAGQAEGPRTQLQRTTMMILAVTLHNIPEGMAVGVVYAGYLTGTAQISAAGALALSLGIAIQNLPAAARRGPEPHARLRGRRALGHRRAGRRSADRSGRALRRPRPALSSELCRRCDALCGRGGADPRDVRGKALEHRHDLFRRRLQCDDDPGRLAGLNRAASAAIPCRISCTWSKCRKAVFGLSLAGQPVFYIAYAAYHPEFSPFFLSLFRRSRRRSPCCKNCRKTLRQRRFAQFLLFFTKRKPATRNRTFLSVLPIFSQVSPFPLHFLHKVLEYYQWN